MFNRDISHKMSLPEPAQALAGRETEMPLENAHFVHGRPIKPPFTGIDAAYEQVLLGFGCFWGAERKFWSIDGIYTTAVGYSAGFTPNPTYEELCSGRTGHNEVVLVVYEPHKISFKAVLKTFFESHNPTQGMRQGNDKGTQYRSGIYVQSEQQHQQAEQALVIYQQALEKAQMPEITTELKLADEFYYAEQHHQQYLAKNPNGYCGLGGTGVSCNL